MNWVTIVLLAAIGWMTFRGYRNGFVRELVGLCALILAVPIAGVFYDDMYPKVQPIVDNEKLAALISFVAILAGVIIGGQVVAHVLKRGVAMLNLGGLDRLAGTVFGFVKAAVLCQVVLIALVVFPSPDLTSDIDHSPVATALLDSAPVVLAILPGRFEQALDAFFDGVKEATQPGLTGRTPTPVP